MLALSTKLWTSFIEAWDGTALDSTGSTTVLYVRGDSDADADVDEADAAGLGGVLIFGCTF